MDIKGRTPIELVHNAWLSVSELPQMMDFSVTPAFWELFCDYIDSQFDSFTKLKGADGKVDRDKNIKYRGMLVKPETR